MKSFIAVCVLFAASVDTSESLRGLYIPSDPFPKEELKHKKAAEKLSNRISKALHSASESQSKVQGVPSGFDWSDASPVQEKKDESDEVGKVIIKTFHTAFIHVIGEDNQNSELQNKIAENDLKNKQHAQSASLEKIVGEDRGGNRQENPAGLMGILGEDNDNKSAEVQGVPSGYDWSDAQPVSSRQDKLLDTIIIAGGGGAIHVGDSEQSELDRQILSGSGLEGKIHPKGSGQKSLSSLKKIVGEDKASNRQKMPAGLKGILGEDNKSAEVQGVPSGYDWSHAQPVSSRQDKLDTIIIAGGGGVIHVGDSEQSELDRHILSGSGLEGKIHPKGSSLKKIVGEDKASNRQKVPASLEGILGEDKDNRSAESEGVNSGLKGIVGEDRVATLKGILGEGDENVSDEEQGVHSGLKGILSEDSAASLKGILGEDKDNKAARVQGVPSGYDWSDAQPLSSGHDDAQSGLKGIVGNRQKVHASLKGILGEDKDNKSAESQGVHSGLKGIVGADSTGHRQKLPASLKGILGEDNENVSADEQGVHSGLKGIVGEDNAGW